MRTAGGGRGGGANSAGARAVTPSASREPAWPGPLDSGGRAGPIAPRRVRELSVFPVPAAHLLRQAAVVVHARQLVLAAELAARTQPAGEAAAPHRPDLGGQQRQVARTVGLVILVEPAQGGVQGGGEAGEVG